jgi:glycosyltransferase involved in cell wall biosynthesis
MERQIIADADLVIFATQGFLDGYAERYPWAAARMRVIPNGYDRTDFANSKSPPGTANDAGSPDGAGGGARRFRLVYTGSVYGEHELEIFLEGLELLVARRPEIKDHLDVEFIGWLSAHNRVVFAEKTKSDPLRQMVRSSGFLPRAEAMRRAAASDALLQIMADDPRKGLIQSAKLVEYLGYDRQILAVVPEGEARQVLHELNWGIAADPTPEGVADGVEKLLSAPPPARRADPDGLYDRANLAARLAGYLDEVKAGRTTGAQATDRP